MHRSLAMMTGFGLLGAIFLAILSTFYLKQIPGKEQIARLEDDLYAEYGAYLDPTTPLVVTMVPPRKRGETRSLEVRCVVRKDLLKRNPKRLDGLLRAIGERALQHPAWRGKVPSVVVKHEAEPKRERVVRKTDLDERLRRTLGPVRILGGGRPPAAAKG